MVKEWSEQSCVFLGEEQKPREQTMQRPWDDKVLVMAGVNIRGRILSLKFSREPDHVGNDNNFRFLFWIR